MTQKEVAKRIRKIARQSSKFKVGKTGLEETKRLAGHKGYKRIKGICWAKTKQPIDHIESVMNTKFINWKNNDNTNEGSAGEMSDSAVKYILYVVYTKRQKPSVKKK